MRILYVDIDTLRPDHLGCYGYHRPTSPNIDAVAAQGVRFEKCYASDTPCLPSRAALFTGRFGTHTGIVKGDGKSLAIAMASIAAKVTRDREMLSLAEQYPEYGFEQHKGYGTAVHRAALHAHGASPMHRELFLRKVLG